MRGYVLAICGVFLFASGIYLGAVANVASVQDKVAQQTIVGLPQFTQSAPKSVDANLFWTVWNMVQQKSVKGPQNESSLFYGAMEGVVASLDDPYSVFFRPEITKEFIADLAGTFEGIGAEIGKKDNQLQIVAPLPDSPAEKAGLKAGDNIVKIDKTESAGLSVDEAVRLIRGKKGTPVTLTIYRSGEQDVRQVTITRAPIDMVTVAFERRPDGIVYARIAHFNEQTEKRFEAVIKEVQKGQAKGLIVDLRNNPGGFLDVAVNLTSEWLEPGAGVVKEQFHDASKNREYHATGAHRLRTVPTVVLVNGGSASASEIMAGALQDHKKATIMGMTTFGKGSVQDFQEFEDGSSLKLTVALWLTPIGRTINEKGVEPDVKVEVKPEEQKPGEDLVLQKAVEYLQNKK